MKILFQLLLLLTLALTGLSKVSASETRVDSTGGLSLVMTDETADLNPFNFGDPAGLSLLPPQSRLDYSYEWFKETGAYNNFQDHLYGTLGELNNDTVGYHGLMLFPTNNWGVQLDGDFFNNENGVGPSFVPTQNDDRTREMFRTAYNFGPFVLGAQVQPVQENLTLNAQNVSGNPVVSQNGTRSGFDGTGGLLISLLGDSGPKKDQLEIGGVYTNQLTPAKEIDNLVLHPTFGSNNFSITQTFTDTTVQSWGPELYFDSPGSFQAALVGRFVTVDTSTQLDSTDTTTIASNSVTDLEETNETVGAAVFKTKNPLPASLTLNSGLLFSFDSSTYNVNQTYLSAGAYNGSQQQWQLEIGTGIEKTGDFTVGFQGKMVGATGSLQSSGTTLSTLNYFSYNVSVGGERWISPKIAFRMGIIYENELNAGTESYQTPYYSLGFDQRIVNTTLITGLGYQDKFLKTDLMLWYGLPSLYNSQSPNAFGTELGVQLAAGIIF